MFVYVTALFILICLPGLTEQIFDRNTFSNVNEMRVTVQINSNILLTQIRSVSANVYKAQAIFGSLNVTLKFPWPLSGNATITLESNSGYAIPNFKVFRNRLHTQFGSHSPLPLMTEIGIGNYGLSLKVLELKFEEKDLKEVQARVSMPGWDIFSLFYFKVLRPQLIITLKLRPGKLLNVKGLGDIVDIESTNKEQGLAIMFTLPVRQSDPLELSVVNRSAVIPYKYIKNFLVISQGLTFPDIAQNVLQDIRVQTFDVRIDTGLNPSISHIALECVASIPWRIRDFTLTNVTLKVQNSNVSFLAEFKIGNQTFHLQMPNNRNNQTQGFLVLERKAGIPDIDEALKYLLQKILAGSIVSLPEFSFVKIFGSKLSGEIEDFKITISKRQTHFTSIFLAIRLTTEWKFFGNNLLVTRTRETNVHLSITSLDRSPKVEANITGKIDFGNPMFLSSHFHVQIPHKVQNMSLDLQPGKVLHAEFFRVLKIENINIAHADVFKSLFAKENVTVSELTLGLPSNFTFFPRVISFKLKTDGTWDLNFIRIKNISFHYMQSKYKLMGQLQFPGTTSMVHISINWPPKTSPIISKVDGFNARDIIRFTRVLSRHFLNGKELELDLKRAGLEKISDFTIRTLELTLIRNLSEINALSVKAVLPKYSWKLIDNFFPVENVTTTINVVIGKSINMTIGGDINLGSGALNIPFEMNIPSSSSNQNISITLGKERKSVIGKFHDITGLLNSATGVQFPEIFGSILPEIHIQVFKVSFTNAFTEVKINELYTKCPKPLDVGGLGILFINDLHLYIADKGYELFGNLLIGKITCPVHFHKHDFQRPTFQLSKPVIISSLRTFISEVFRKVLPKIKDVPVADMLGLGNVGFRIQKANIVMTRDINFESLDIEISIPPNWSFFNGIFELKNYSIQFKAYFLHAQMYYEFAIHGVMEMSLNRRTKTFHLVCNIPSSPSSPVKLALSKPAEIELSDISSMPLAGKLIPENLLSPIFVVGPIHIDKLVAFLKSGIPTSLLSLDMKASVLTKTWKIPGVPVIFQNMNFRIWYVESKFNALLFGMVTTAQSRYSIYFQIPFIFHSDLQNVKFVSIQFKFTGVQGLPDFPHGLSLNETSSILVPGFDLMSLFPDAFDPFKVKFERFNLRIVPPLTIFILDGFDAKFRLANRVELVKDWLAIENITAELDVQTKGSGRINASGSISCLMHFGSTGSGLRLWSSIAIPSPPSKKWILKIFPESSASLSMTRVASLFLDFKSFFPLKWLAKVINVQLTDLEVTFYLDPNPHIQRVQCFLQINLNDFELPLKISLEKVQIYFDIYYPLDHVKRRSNVEMLVWIRAGDKKIQTTLFTKPQVIVLETRELPSQKVDMKDLARLVGGAQLLRMIPKTLLDVRTITLNKINMTFSKTEFSLQDIHIICDLDGFDAGFSFPLPLPDQKNVFHAELKVNKLELAMKRSTWSLKADIIASISGLSGKIDPGLKNLEAELRISPGKPVAIEIKKTILDLKFKVRLGGMDLDLSIHFLKPKILFPQSDMVIIRADIDVSGFHKLNMFLPFDVFDNTIKLAVLIQHDTDRPLRIQMKTLPILENIIPCEKEKLGEGKFKCDFTWLCNSDSYVYLRSPSFSYTEDGFESRVDVQGIDKLCIPITPRFLWDFIKNIPILGHLFPRNFRLWPPPNIKKLLKKILININNLPKGMEQFIEPKFPDSILASVVVPHNGPLQMSLKVANGESLIVPNVLSFPILMSGVVFREFTIGTFFGIPFVNVDFELYIWNLQFLIPLSHLPKENPLLINAMDFETRIVCKDCYFVILGAIPVPIFASPFHLSFPTLVDANAKLTIYHKRPGFKDFEVFASLLKGLFKFFTEKDYLLSINDFGGVNASKDLLVVKLNHENYKTMVELPKYMGRTQLGLDLPPLDAKSFLIGYLNYFKTFKIKWLLSIVPLKYRIIDVGINVGAFSLASLKFAASTSDELKNNSVLWKYPVVSAGDDALVIASLDTFLLSLNLRIKAKSMINADLNFTLEAGFTDVVKIDLDARAMINFEDMSNPLLLGGRCSLYLFSTKLLAGSAYISGREIQVSGQLNLNFLGLLKFHGFVKASFRSGEFLLSSKAGVEFVGIKFLDSYLRIRNSLRVTEVSAKTSFMGSSLRIELIRNGLSFKLKGSAPITIEMNIDLGELKLLGKSIGRIKLNAGVFVDLKISLPGKSSMLISFYFFGEKFSLPKLEVDTKDCRPDRIPGLVSNWLKEKALSLIKSLFSLNPEKYLKALVYGAIKIGEAAITIVKDLLKAGHKFIGSVVKEIGNLGNKIANAAREIAKAADEAKKTAMKAAKALRETAENAAKKAKEAVKAIGNVVRDVGKKLAQITEDLCNTIKDVARLENVVAQGNEILKSIEEGIKNFTRKIEKIVKKILDEIARGIRNALGKVIKLVGGWFGKRSLYYRRDVLTSEKSYFERRKREFEIKESNIRTRIRAQEKELKQSKKLEAIKRATRNKVLQESETANKHLDRAIRDDIGKTAIVEDLLNQGKCVTGENNCHPNATCLRTGEHGESFKCMCRRGWIGDGISCETPIREVTVTTDVASAVGEAVNVAAFTLSGTNVEYKFSFQDSYNSSSFQTYIFNKTGVYKVGVFARNSVSNASDDTSVVIQEPVSNLKLMINGDRRPCSPLELIPTSGGTNVTFDIIFGDNTTAYNITKSITHYYGLSGTYNINVIAQNLVSSANSSYVFKIRWTPCDQLYCDISGIERKVKHKSLQDIANLAWEMAKSSKDVITYSDPPAWRYFAAVNPLSTNNLDKPYSISVNQKRIYSINNSNVDIALVYVGITASLIKQDVVVHDGSVKAHCRKPTNVTAVLMLEALLDVQEKDILDSWRADMDNDHYCNKIVLQEERIRGSIDGYLLGGMLVNSTFKLSDVIYNYYCPNLENAITLPFVYEERYDVFLDTLRTKFPQRNLSLFQYLGHVAEQIKITSKLEEHQSSSNCLRLLASYLSQRIKKSTKIGLEDTCGSWKSCGNCLSFGGKDNCSWCGESSKCILKMNISACKPLEQIVNLPCPNQCSKHSNCQECMHNHNCGWCSSVNVHSSGVCTEGNRNGPLQPGLCSKKDWFIGQCGHNCYTDKKCSGRFGKCMSGKCTCVTGYYGPECSKLGCIYRIGFKDTADSIARLFHIMLEDLPHSHGDERLTLTPNAVITIPLSNTINKLCLNHPKKATFHPLFPRLLRGSKNLVNKKSYCGLFGSLAKEDNSLFCKNVSDEEQCKRLAECTWNAIDPCTGVPVEGCNSLSTKTQLLVPENMTIVAPISGNIETGKDYVLISGWPGQEWENCLVNISHIRPLKITSVLAGKTLGLGALEGNPMLPNYFEVALVHEGSTKNPEEYLLPCAPGCAQLNDLGNGICNARCNVSECNFDDGDCLNQSTFRRQISLPQNTHFHIFMDKSWHVLHKLYKMTREKKIEIKGGPLSVYGLSENIVSEMLVSSDLTSPMVYDKYMTYFTKHFNALLDTNSTKGQMVVALAQRLTLIGSEVSPYISPNEKSQTIDINVKSLKNPNEFERALQVLQGYEQLIYVKVDGNFTTTAKKAAFYREIT